MASKQVQGWSQIFNFVYQLALHAKRDNFNWHFCIEKRDSQNITKHRQYVYIYHFEEPFATINNLESLPSNSQSFSLDWAPNVRIARKMRNFWQLSMVDLALDGRVSSCIVDRRWNYLDPMARSPEKFSKMQRLTMAHTLPPLCIWGSNDWAEVFVGSMNLLG